MIKFLSRAKQSEIKGIALLRLDFNTQDEWRMELLLPTIKFLLRSSSKIIIISHRGRPTGIQRGLSLREKARDLEKLIKRRVIFIPHFRFEEIQRTIQRAPHGSVFVLENIRFLKGERENDPRLAKELASLADFYVNDSFAVSHRKNASVSAITKFLPSYGGLILEQELVNLSRIMKRPKRPLLLLMAGAKAEDKWNVIQHMRTKADVFILGGALAHSILWVQGMDIGDSIYDREAKRTAKRISRYSNVILPIDFRAQKKKMLDIGPKSEKVFARLLRTAKTIVWNGPFGQIEKKKFSHGTLTIARAMARNKKAFTLAGGGETVMFLKKYKLDKKFSFISTGGGAMFEFLAGKKLPGIEALKRSRK